MKPDFFKIWGDLLGMFSRRPLIFFYILDVRKSSSYTGESLRKKSMLENFHTNVLNPEFYLKLDIQMELSPAIGKYLTIVG